MARISTNFLIISIVLLALLLTATSATKRRCKKVNKFCGALPHQPKCCGQLTCKLYPKNPSVGGKCVPPTCQGVNKPCEGFVINPPKCCRGLTCKLNVTIPDLPGVCVPAPKTCQDVDEHCGGFIANAPQCCPGLTCKLGNIPDIGGVCVRPN